MRPLLQIKKSGLRQSLFAIGLPKAAFRPAFASIRSRKYARLSCSMAGDWRRLGARALMSAERIQLQGSLAGHHGRRGAVLALDADFIGHDFSFLLNRVRSSKDRTSVAFNGEPRAAVLGGRYPGSHVSKTRRRCA
jgi:hypothetical protein